MIKPERARRAEKKEKGNRKREKGAREKENLH